MRRSVETAPAAPIRPISISPTGGVVTLHAVYAGRLLPSCDIRAWMFEKEAHHLLCRIRASRIGIGTGAAAARPGMTGAMNAPRLQHHPPCRIGEERPCIGMPTGHLAMLDHSLELGACAQLPKNLLGIARMHDPVVISVEDDRRNDRSGRVSGRWI